MNQAAHHLAQVNIARMRAPLEDPLMAGFAAQLDPVNAVADESPGFVWRLQSDEGDATALRVFEDERILINMSVWTSVEALQAYVYRGAHRGPLRNRKRWFEPLDGPHTALWWIPKGTLPTVEDAKERLEALRRDGPTPYAFTFKEAFPPPQCEAQAASTQRNSTRS